MTELQKAIEEFLKEYDFTELSEPGISPFKKELNALIELACKEQKSIIINELSKKLKWIEIHPKIIHCIENAPSPNQKDK